MKPTPEQALAEMRASAERHRAQMKPPAARIVMPPEWEDVTGRQDGTSLAVVSVADE